MANIDSVFSIEKLKEPSVVNQFSIPFLIHTEFENQQNAPQQNNSEQNKYSVWPHKAFYQKRQSVLNHQDNITNNCKSVPIV